MSQVHISPLYLLVIVSVAILLVLPLISVFSGIALASIEALSLVYLVALPLWMYLYIHSSLSKIQDTASADNASWKTLNTRALIIAVLALITVAVVGMLIENSIRFSDEEIRAINEISPNRVIIQPTILQYVIPLAIAISLGIYLLVGFMNKAQMKNIIFNPMILAVIPMILGIGVAFIKIVTILLFPVVPLKFSTNTLGTSGGPQSFLMSFASQFELQLITGLYALITIVLLSYFVAKIKFGDSKAPILMNIGISLLIGISVFVVSLAIGNYLLYEKFFIV